MTNPSFILRNALYLNTLYDVLVINGNIAAFEVCGSINAPADITSIDAKKCILFPSFIDAHTHMRDPGFEYKEDITSGLTAAAYGGFGAIMAMANTKPINDTAAVTRYMIEKAKKAFPYGPQLCPVGALTTGLKGKELASMAELSEAGCVAFSNDGHPVPDTEIFRRAVEYASVWGKTVIDHCEDPYLADGSHMNEGMVSGKIGIKGQPTVAEALHVARDILLAEYLDISIHLAHISCRQSVELIAWAKARGIKVTAETCPHYLLLDESSLENYDPMAKMNPPLRTPEDVKAMVKAVQDGTIDMLVTDHAPHADHEKDHPLDETPNGIIGLETAVPLSYSFVKNNIISEKDLIRLWHDAPAKIFSIPVNSFKEGDPADFFLFNPSKTWILTHESIHSKSYNTPFLGQTMHGKVMYHWMKGNQLL